MSSPILRVHPAIAFARVGDSESFYLAPETVAGMPTGDPDIAGGLPIHPDTQQPITSDDIRDADGRFKRQAARFRIYHYPEDSTGTYPTGAGTEIVIGSHIGGKKVVDIVWTVHVANKKANWYLLPETGIDAYEEGHLPPLRNPSMGAEPGDRRRRRRLVIDPGPRAIRGTSHAPVRMDARTTPSYATRYGEIVQKPSYPRSFPADHFPTAFTPRGPIDTLGELSTDEYGHLIVAGGYGRAVGIRKPDGTVYPLFAAVNNDGWFDDTGDGPVSAVVCFEDGSTAEAQGAWFVCTDPGYAPQTLNVVSLWDEIYNTFIREPELALRPEVYRNGAYVRGYEPYFDSELKPIFRAAALTRWNTNLPSIAIRAHDAVGRIGPDDRPEDTIIAGLAYIRNPNRPGEAGVGVPLMPLALGDAGNSFLQPTFTQYFFLEQWSQGKARKDTTEMAFGPGEALDRASLYNCLGGRFSPGIDMTFIVRDTRLWTASWKQAGPFRIRAKALDYEAAREDEPFLTEGYIPLRESAEPNVEPGDGSKFMSVPWHTDYNSCATHNPDPNPVNNTTLFWSWPAQRPVAVHVAADVRGGELGGQRYSVRGPGTLSPDPSAQGRYKEYLAMVENWSRIGVVIQGSRITGGKYSPDHFLEVQSQLDEPPVPPWPQNTLNDD